MNKKQHYFYLCIVFMHQISRKTCNILTFFVDFLSVSSYPGVFDFFLLKAGITLVSLNFFLMVEKGGELETRILDKIFMKYDC